jgi:hypothetical protein
MKHLKMQHIEAHDIEVVDHVTCDLCRRPIPDERFKVDEVEVSRRQGDVFPEGGSGTTTSFDICGECWEQILAPFLERMGAEPQTHEWEF